MIPHVTQFDEADITEPRGVARRAQQGEREGGHQGHDARVPDQGVGRGAAEVSRLQRLARRRRTSSCKQYFNIGFAADTPNGLVVPVIKNADQKGVLQIAKEMGELSAKAREGKLGPADMQGGCFSISLARRHRRHRVHADHQRAGSRDPRRVEERDEAGVGRQGVRAAPDAAAVAVLRSSRDRRRGGGALHRVPAQHARRHAARARVADRCAALSMRGIASRRTLALLDDIATILDDVADRSPRSPRARRRVVLGDDLALNAQQVTGVRADRELPVVWAVRQGVVRQQGDPRAAALLISAFAPWAITPLLMLGGAFLCYEGFEKVAHQLPAFEAADDEADHERADQGRLPTRASDVVALERSEDQGRRSAPTSSSRPRSS